MADGPKFPDTTPEEAARMRENSRERGMTFEVFLPEGLSDWLQELLTKGVFESPKEAAFVAFQSLRDLHTHPKIQKQLLTAMLEASINDPSPVVPTEEAFDRLKRQLLGVNKPGGA